MHELEYLNISQYTYKYKSRALAECFFPRYGYLYYEIGDKKMATDATVV